MEIDIMPTNQPVIQCVSVDSASLIIYPEIKATEVTFSALKRYLCSFYFRIDNETGGIHRNTLYIPVRWAATAIAIRRN